MTKATIFALLCLGMAACSSSTAPTHRWASSADVDKVKYRQDHARCQAASKVAGTELDPTSTEFNAYKQCMVSNGYELTALR